MNIPVLGIFFPIEEAIVITCIIIVIYLIVLRFEFKQLSMISKKIGNEETELNKEIKELQQELSLFSDSIKNKGTGLSSIKADEPKIDESKSDDVTSDNAESKETKSDDTKSDDSKSEKSSPKETKSDDTKSNDNKSEEERLKSMLD